jgi:hypothetical protein
VLTLWREKNTATRNQQKSERQRHNHTLTIAKVLGGRKQPIRQLWI